MFHLAARSWIGQVEAACIEWLACREVERATPDPENVELLVLCAPSAAFAQEN